MFYRVFVSIVLSWVCLFWKCYIFVLFEFFRVDMYVFSGYIFRWPCFVSVVFLFVWRWGVDLSLLVVVCLFFSFFFIFLVFFCFVRFFWLFVFCYLVFFWFFLRYFRPEEVSLCLLSCAYCFWVVFPIEEFLRELVCFFFLYFCVLLLSWGGFFFLLCVDQVWFFGLRVGVMLEDSSVGNDDFLSIIRHFKEVYTHKLFLNG